MTGRQGVALRALWLSAWAACAGCTQHEAALSQAWDNVCIDADGDGFGFQCAPGADCDDADVQRHEQCERCQKPEQDCACREGEAPQDCRLPHLLDQSGALLCRSGTRYCRAGSWSDCEGVASFLVPVPAALGARALIDPSAPAVVCDPCNPDCYRVEDPLITPPGTAAGPGLAPAVGGGITLAPLLPDAGVALARVLDDPPCPADDADCDGLPDAFDPEPATPAAGSRHRTVFMDLPAGASAAQLFDGAPVLRSADLYFYLDTTSFMEGPRDRLIAELSAGNFLPGAGADLTCADSDGDGAPNQELKTLGIAGNARCLLADVRFGAGWFRDIPFEGPFAATSDMVAPWDYEMFEHRQDIAGDAASVRAAISQFELRANLNVPEGGMQGLWALATGAELYAGWDRSGIPARRGCPPGSWGYACFRDAALPIVFQITDAPMQNGPPTPPRPTTNPATPENCLSDALESTPGVQCAPLDYDQGVLRALRAGSEGSYRALNGAAESLAAPEDVGVIDDVLITYTGSTQAMHSDVAYDASQFVFCPQANAWSSLEQAAPDAVFRFRVETAGEYLISARGSRFDTSLMLLSADAQGRPSGALACSDDDIWDSNSPGQRGDTAELNWDFTPGDYLVVLKGYRSSARGDFQLSFGSRARQVRGTFQAQRWLGPNGDGAAGVRRALTDRAMRVITLQSSSDWYAAQQARALAGATQALGADGAPLTFQIGADGSGLGSAVVQALQELSQNLALDVHVALASAPENPGFELQVEALDQSGDGCDPPVDSDGDLLPDTHLHCQPDARPRFRVSFRNPPAPAAVRPNAADPAGGYPLTLQVLGDGKLLLDQIPVYIVPVDAIPDPAPALFAAAASYQQEVPANGCDSGEGPSWRTLYWDASLPSGTRIVFELCSGDSDQELAACSFHQVAELTPGDSCAIDADCGGIGYCGASGVCQRVLGSACAMDDECGVGGSCVALDQGHVCTAPRSAIDLRPAAAAGLQGKRRGLVRIGLYASADGTQAPTIRTWRVDYTCAARE